ncbi:MAG TPA: extracellular solute-binding protein [Thermoanaerobaculia bacterium]|nr:extracellular solute-binding protein [Thermoanaerobaculia bacterium]
MRQLPRFLRLLGLSWAALAVGCGDGRTPLVVYSPHGRDLLVTIERAFEAEHPDLDLRFLDMGSQEVLDRVRSERANPQADVWYGGPSTLFVRASSEGLLAAFEPTWTAAVPAAARDPQRRWSALYRTPTLLVYNRDALTAEQAPTDWEDLLDPRFEGQVLIRDPLASGTMRTIFGALISRAVDADGGPEAGFDWLRRLDAQTKEYVHSPALLHEKMIRQEGLVTVWEATDILGMIARGAPLAYRFPTSGAPVIEDSIAVVAGARHREAAESFVEWIGLPEALLLAAEEAFRIPAREDLPPAAMPSWVGEVMAELRPESVDWDRLEREGAGWMATWDRTVRGRGGR